MGFLRRLLGGEAPKADVESTPPVDDAELDAAEKAYEIELLREEQDRLSDLARRQLRYADYAWKPPGQGGERRADERSEDDSMDGG